MPLNMSREEREDFLAGVHVGMPSVASDTSGSPLAMPVWYTYQPGGTVNVITGRGTRKSMAIRAAGRFSLCAQTSARPTSTSPSKARSSSSRTPARTSSGPGPRVPGPRRRGAYVTANPRPCSG
jgi:hypothetical protein